MFRIRTLIACCAVVVAGCATTDGTSFDLRQARQFMPGKASRAEVLAKLGPSSSSRVSTMKKDLAEKELPSPVILDQISYYFSDRNAQAIYAGATPSRSANFYFSGGQLLASYVRSSFAGQSTDFDESAAARLIKGQTTQADVLSILGEPGGRSIYPAAKQPGGSSWNYDVACYDKGIGKTHKKSLWIFFDANGVLSDFDLSINDE